MILRQVSDRDELSEAKRSKELLSYVPENPFTEKPNAHILLVDSNEITRACCSLWWEDCPALGTEKLGCIGHFFAVDETSGRRVLADACSILGEMGIGLFVGPMNGNTWRKYRLVTESSEEPPFALEPVNPDWWPQLWMDAGFGVLAGYHSSVINDLSEGDPRVPRTVERLERSGIRVRELNVVDFESDLKRIYAVSERSFAANFLYTPLALDDFLGMYLPFKDYVDPRFALIAEDQGSPIGFVFSLPDLAQAQRGEKCDTLIIKTLAVLPGRAHAGLGSVLVDRMREAALDAAYRRVIHALMFDQNTSVNIGKNSVVLRRYSLFSKRLAL